MRWSVVLCLLVGWVSVEAGRAWGEEPVDLPDPALKAVVEEALGVADPTPDDLLALARLSCTYRGIKDLTGLDLASNLVHLDLQGNQVSDVRPLAGLANLTYLDLQDNLVADPSPLAGLTNLTLLDLQGNGIRDIGWITGLTNLTSLCLWDDHVTDISPLSGLTRLNRLFLTGNGIRDVGPLGSLVQLTELYLSDNRITDPGPLAGLKDLANLWLNGNQVGDLAPLAGLTNLTLLNLEDNQVSDIGPLAGLTGLEVLSLSGNQISDPSPLAQLTSLVVLSLAHDPLSDVSPLAALNRLISLDLEACGIRHIGPLAGLTPLVNLDLGGNQIADVSPLSALTRLAKLDLSNNQIEDIGPLAGLVLLTSLDLDGNQISDIGSLAHLTSLSHLTLGHNLITDTGPLAGLSGLSYLSLEENQISDIGCLMGFCRLCWLDLSGNPLSEQSRTVCMPRILAMNPGLNIESSSWVSLTVQSSLGGTVTSPGEGTTPCKAGQPVWIEAQPGPLFRFVGWTGAFTGTTQAFWLTLDSDLTVRPVFVSVLDSLHVQPVPAAGLSAMDKAAEDGTPEHPFHSIQEAIQVAAEGSTVIVHPGRYAETIDFLGKAITVMRRHPDADQESYPDPSYDYPVIDAQGSGTAVSFVTKEGPAARLEGFVITGGKGGWAGAIACRGASPVIANCLIAGNRTVISEGGCVQCMDSSAVLVNCTISGNLTGPGGAAICLVDSDVTLVNSIVWDNSPRQIRVASGPLPDITYSDVQGGWDGEGNLDLDPYFVQCGEWIHPDDQRVTVDPLDPEAVWLEGDYHLMSQLGRWEEADLKWISDPLTSPCIDAGNPNTPAAEEPQGGDVRVNLGVYGGTDQASRSRMAP